MREKHRVGIIGNIGNGTQIGGQITKTVELYHFFKNRDESIELLNVYGINPLMFIRKLVSIFKNNENIIIILASTGYFRICPLIIFLKKKYNCRVHEIVIGGIRHNYIVEKHKRLRNEKQINHIYVESKYMVREYRKLGLTQTEYLPNYKSFQVLSPKEIENNRSDGCLWLCTFSRIDEYKGIDTAIEIVEKMNQLNSVRKIRLDIIGPVKEDYRETFKNVYANADRNYINYIGIIETEKAQEILKKYDALLFPTHWNAEGFPGTFIDALSAGLPVVSSRRENFKDIIENGVNGYLIADNDIDSFCNVIQEFIDDKDKLAKMKIAALASAKQYLSEIVLEKLWRRCK